MIDSMQRDEEMQSGCFHHKIYIQKKGEKKHAKNVWLRRTEENVFMSSEAIFYFPVSITGISHKP